MNQNKGILLFKEMLILFLNSINSEMHRLPLLENLMKVMDTFSRKMDKIFPRFQGVLGAHCGTMVKGIRIHLTLEQHKG